MTRVEAPVEPAERLEFPDSDVFMHLCGDGNERLRLLEQAAGVSIHARGCSLTITGEPMDVASVRNALEQLYQFAERGEPLGAEDAVRAVRILRRDPTVRLQEIFADLVLTPRRGKPIAPKGITQKHYVDLVRAHDLVFAIGPAGTGKTYLAMAMAVRALLDKKVARIVLTRPAVEAGERLGFLPGSLAEKVDPYLRPLFDALHDMLEFERTQRLVDQGVIEVAPLAFMRGRTLNDSFVILDEAQNTTPEQMKMFLTRLGFGSRAIVTGDATQSDLREGQKSGLSDAKEALQSVREIGFVHFSDADVVRHPLVQSIIRAYERRDSRNLSSRDEAGRG